MSITFEISTNSETPRILKNGENPIGQAGNRCWAWPFHDSAPLLAGNETPASLTHSQDSTSAGNAQLTKQPNLLAADCSLARALLATHALCHDPPASPKHAATRQRMSAAKTPFAVTDRPRATISRSDALAGELHSAEPDSAGE
jgi:hypothetical protein